MFSFKSALTGAFMCIAAAMFSTHSAQATLLSVDDSTGAFGMPGSGAVTFDDATNLEWLDLTESIDRSFNDVSTHFGSGGDYEGWRHATTAEIVGTDGRIDRPVGSYIRVG